MKADVKTELDLNLPADFGDALATKITRPFVFGPVEFTNLDVDPAVFDAE